MATTQVIEGILGAVWVTNATAGTNTIGETQVKSYLNCVNAEVAMGIPIQQSQCTVP